MNDDTHHRRRVARALDRLRGARNRSRPLIRNLRQDRMLSAIQEERARFMSATVVTDSDATRILALVNKFITTSPMLPDPRNENWHGAQILGRGGQGVAGLWLKTDSTTNAIVSRMVIKQEVPTDRQWNRHNMWFQDRRDKIPREAAINILLNRKRTRQLDDVIKAWYRGHGKPSPVRNALRSISRAFRRLNVGATSTADTGLDGGDDHDVDDDRGIPIAPAGDASASNGIPSLDKDNGIVEGFAYSVMADGRATRLYMEYMRYGDIAGLMNRYAHAWPVYYRDRATGARRSGTRKHDPLPEPFLWWMLYRLMLACREMQYIPRVKGRYPPYIVHQDIKDLNVFLGEADPNHYPAWPTIKLADFGSAHLTDAKDETNQKFWFDPRTVNWIYPEFAHHLETHPNQPVTPAANVWQCAYVVYILMLQRPNAWFDFTSSATPYSADHANPYSTGLNNLMARCLDRVPGNRPAPDEIIATVERNEHLLLDRMRDYDDALNRPANFIDWGRDAGADAYAVGMRFRPLPMLPTM